MSIKTFTDTIKDSENVELTVQTSSFPGRMGAKLGVRLLRILGSFLKAIPSTTLTDLSPANKHTIKSKPGLLDSEINFEMLSKTIVDSLDDKTMISLIEELLTFTVVNGQRVGDPAIFDIVFAGEYGLLIKTLKFVLSVNFKSFFGGSNFGEVLSKKLQQVMN